MRLSKWIVIVVAAVLVGCADKNAPDTELVVTECAAMAEGRASSAACAANGKAYVFGGRDANKKYLKELWQYDAAADAWSKIGEVPDKARVNAAIVADEDCLYMGLGFSGESAFADSCYLRDWWKYSLTTGSWTRLADYPNEHSNAAVMYKVGRRIYAVYGFGLGWTSQVVYYDIDNDQWHKYGDNSNRARPSFGGVGGQSHGKCYFGTGYRNANMRYWYEVDLENDDWTEKASLPGKGRVLCAGCGTSEYVYVFGGRCFSGEYTGGEVMKEMLRYIVAEDKWQRCGTLKCGRAENMIAFTIGDKAYYGLGEDENGKVINKIYRVE